MDEFEDITYLLQSVIYLLLMNGEVVYVGRTSNVIRRLQAHTGNARMKFNQVKILRCDIAEASRLEAYYIARFNPKLNSARPTPRPFMRIDLAALGLKRRTMRRRRV